MKPCLLISGNRTGFSRFFASDNIEEIYKSVKFDFDLANSLTFIEKNDKIYCISFSPNLIAVSLFTRMLDSFRRPGLLVMTTLIPRNYAIVDDMNRNDKAAVYRLLNEVNDRFYEKNVINGVLNQNPAVLRQDYYADILSRYSLEMAPAQKQINSSINASLRNKQIGYVNSSENDIPKYLSSMMRDSYSGYHHVFIGEKAPQNIEEPPEEIFTYRVRVENDKSILPRVTLNDRIPVKMPQPGERDIPNKDFTYNQVLNGEAGQYISASIENDETIVLTYHFPHDTKTFHFKFFDGAIEVCPFLKRVDSFWYVY